MIPEEYIAQFASLKLDRSSGHPKPHKACLLLAIMDCIQSGILTTNRIELNEELRKAFSRHFYRCRKGNDQNRPETPFFHLQSADFWMPWHVAENTGKYEVRRATGPKDTDYVTIDEGLFALLADPQWRPQLVAALLGALDFDVGSDAKVRDDMVADLEQLANNGSLLETERQTLQAARLGQGAFRNQLIEHWQGCAVTGYRDVRLLVASHIKPWRSSDNRERLDPFNGLLLLPNLDKVFDRCLVSFDEDGRIIISDILDDPERIGISPSMRVELDEAHQGYLVHHRRSFNEKSTKPANAD